MSKAEEEARDILTRVVLADSKVKVGIVVDAKAWLKKWPAGKGV